MRTLYVAASGMTAQQTRLDNVANNLANINTTGFKRSRASFQDLFYQELSYGGQTAAGGDVQIGGGVQLADIQKDHARGTVTQTGDGLHVAIERAGFLALETPDGDRVYTRDGAFEVRQGEIVHSTTGFRPAGDMRLPYDTAEVSFDESGTLWAMREDDDAPYAVGQLDVVNFASPHGLRAVGSNLFAETEASGEAVTPDEAPRLQVRALENSNVDAADELIAMIMAQRAYELNSKVVQAADETMQQTANLRR